MSSDTQMVLCGGGVSQRTMVTSKDLRQTGIVDCTQIAVRVSDVRNASRTTVLHKKLNTEFPVWLGQYWLQCWL